MCVFENDVKTYGTQTVAQALASALKFENDVKTYGTQTRKYRECMTLSLRMM